MINPKPCITIEKEFNNGEVSHSRPELATIPRALTVLLDVQLMWGARITELSETGVVTVSNVLGATDRISFRGRAEDMVPLLQAIKGWYDSLEVAPPSAERVMRVLDPEGKGISPLLLSLALPLAMGERRPKLLKLAVCGVVEEPTILRGMALTGRDDLDSALELWLGESAGTSFSAVLDQLGL